MIMAWPSPSAHDPSRDLGEELPGPARPDESKRPFPELVTADHLSTRLVLVLTSLS